MCVYRPPDSSDYSKPFSVFLSEFSELLQSLISSKSDYVITGDLNIHLDIPSDPHSEQFLDLLKSCNAVQHCNFSTHSKNHTLDVIISPTSSSIIDDSVTVLPVTPSDHLPIVCHFDHTRPTDKPVEPANVSFRQLAKINVSNFMMDINSSSLIISLLATAMPRQVLPR